MYTDASASASAALVATDLAARAAARPRPTLRLFLWLLLALDVGYLLAATLVLAYAPQSRCAQNYLAPWLALPLQCSALLAGSALLSLRETALTGPTRRVIALSMGFALLSIVATVLWNEVRPTGQGPVFGLSDGVYLADYVLVTLAYADIYRRFGGSFRSVRTWLDGATICIALLGAFWAVLNGPLMPDNQHHSTISLTLPYTVVLVTLMTMAALLWLRLPSPRAYPEIALLILAGLADAAWEITWLSGWLTDSDFVGLFYNYGDAICFTAVVAAAAISLRPAARPPLREVAGRVDSFVPVLMALVSIALIASAIATTRALGAWALIGLVACTSLLVMTRQRTVRVELEALNRRLAQRAADERLTELVRLSTDLILVVDGHQRVTFASPACVTLLGVSPAALQGRDARELFGAASAPILADFLAGLAQAGRDDTSLELTMDTPGAQPRTILVTGNDQLANPQVGGVVLTVADVTEKRALERQVLDISTHERVRFAADIHDGLGQELTGIAMMIKGAATRHGDELPAHRADLERIVAQMNATIVNARNLARGLSPLEVVRGSLAGALASLAEDLCADLPTRVVVDPALEAADLDDATADHLYRIAHEAAVNAVRHSGCRQLEVAVRVNEDTVELRVDDDGSGLGEARARRTGLGLRLMAYRARLIGGTLDVGRNAHGGTGVQVVVPLRRLITTPASTGLA